MFFGPNRKKIAKEVINSVVPLFRVVERMTGKTASQFSGDSYVLGYVVGVSGLLAKAASNNALNPADIGFVTMDVVESIFGKSGTAAMQQAFGELKQGRNAAFQRGISNGQKNVMVSLGNTAPYKDDPDVKAAFSGLRIDQAEDAAAKLQQRLFYDHFA